MTTTNAQPKCEWCGFMHFDGTCPRVKALEYYQDGTLKRVEFHPDQPIISGPQVTGAPSREPTYPIVTSTTLPEFEHTTRQPGDKQ